jgi:hypothetical protein
MKNRATENKLFNPIFEINTFFYVNNIACIFHAFNLAQMRGVESRRYSILFQGFRNEADELK